MARKIVDPKRLPKPMGPYSHCVVAEGSRLVFISGQVPQDANGQLVGKGDIAAQTRQVLANIRAAVEAAGGTVRDINKITIFMVELDPAAYAAVAEARREFFQGEYPASTLVQVKALASPDWLIEIEAYAVI
jgi:2-iminobutanoate/2-iminopropanoate deaminase